MQEMLRMKCSLVTKASLVPWLHIAKSNARDSAYESRYLGETPRK